VMRVEDMGRDELMFGAYFLHRLCKGWINNQHGI